MKLTPSLGGAYSGSMGGLTASRNKGGQYFRRRAMPTNPQTPQQERTRASFAAAALMWGNLTQEVRDGWTNYAKAVDWKDSLGQTIRLTGMQMFVRTQQLLQLIELIQPGEGPTLTSTFPEVDNLGQEPKVIDVSAVRTPQTTPTSLVLNVETELAESEVVADVFFLGAAKNPTINYFKGPYLYIGVNDSPGGQLAITLDGSTAPTIWFDRNGVPAEGRRLFGYVRRLMSDGRMSEPTRFQTEVITASE